MSIQELAGSLIIDALYLFLDANVPSSFNDKAGTKDFSDFLEQSVDNGASFISQSSSINSGITFNNSKSPIHCLYHLTVNQGRQIQKMKPLTKLSLISKEGSNLAYKNFSVRDIVLADFWAGFAGKVTAV